MTFQSVLYWEHHCHRVATRATAVSIVVCVCQLLCISVTNLFLHWKVTIDLELHLSKRTKSSRGPFAHYEVYLYRVPKTTPQIPNGPKAKTVNSPSRPKDRVLRWEDDTYPPSPPCSVCSPVSTQSLPASMINEPQRPRPWTLNPYTPWRTIHLTLLAHSGKLKFTNISVEFNLMYARLKQEVWPSCRGKEISLSVELTSVHRQSD